MNFRDHLIGKKIVKKENRERNRRVIEEEEHIFSCLSQKQKPSLTT